MFVTRFAPSPTGELHLGHVYHALWVWGIAREFGAEVVIRMEDHDRYFRFPYSIRYTASFRMIART